MLDARSFELVLVRPQLGYDCGLVHAATLLYIVPHLSNQGVVDCRLQVWDATVATRFHAHPEAQAIRAKTGSLSHVRAMSGYADTSHYGPVAFSFLINNFDAPTVEIRRLLDQIGMALLE
jgi:hypothetical protein